MKTSNANIKVSFYIKKNFSHSGLYPVTQTIVSGNSITLEHVFTQASIQRQISTNNGSSNITIKYRVLITNGNTFSVESVITVAPMFLYNRCHLPTMPQATAHDVL